jgi:hypothetical protein
MNRRVVYQLVMEKITLRLRWPAPVLAAIFAVLLGSSSALAQNYQLYPVGERAAGMGGAYIGLADDASACYYNPAGLAFARYNQFSVSGTAYGFSRVVYSDFAFFGNTKAKSAKFDNFFSFPTYFATIYRLGGDDKPVARRSALGFSVVTPDYYENRSQLETDGGAVRAIVNDKVQTYWFGPSYAFRLGDNFALGATLHGLFGQEHYNSQFAMKLTRAQWSLLSGPMRSTDFSDETRQTLNLLGNLGARAKFGMFNAGLMARTPSFMVWGRGDLTEQGLLTYEGTVDEDGVSTDFKPRREDPWMVGAGFGVSRRNNFAAGLDVKYHGAVAYKTADDKRVSERIDNHGVVNANLGGEYVVAGTVPLRAGFYTNLSPVNDQKKVEDEIIDLYGLTVSGGVTRENYAISLGVNYAFGSGTSELPTFVERNGNLVEKTKTIDVEVTVVNLFITSSYRFGGAAK